MGIIYTGNNEIVTLYRAYGFILDEEKQKAEETEIIYNTIRTVGIEVIECVYV